MMEENYSHRKNMKIIKDEFYPWYEFLVFDVMYNIRLHEINQSIFIKERE